MSQWNDTPYSYVPSASRLLGPVNQASSPVYNFKARNSLVQEAVQYSKDVEYYDRKSVNTDGSAPNIAPGVPLSASVPTASSITMYFTVAGITADPPPEYAFLYGTTSTPTTVFPATRASAQLALYVATFTNLVPSTTYYFRSVAANVIGGKISTVSAPQTTAAAGATPVSGPPSTPQLIGIPTASSFTVQFDTAGITGTAPIRYSVLVGVTPSPAAPFPATLVSGTLYQAVITGLEPNSGYYVTSVASNPAGQAQSLVSDRITTGTPAPLPALKTNLVLPFLIQGPRFNTPYSTALDYYINVDAVGAVLVPGATSISGTQVFGSMYGGTIGSPSQAGLCTSDQPYSNAYGAVTDAYLKPLQTAGSRLLTSWGGYYADILGLFGPYQPLGFPGTNPSSAAVVQSFLFNYCGITASNTNPLGWSRSGYSTYFDGLVLDFENVGYGGNPNVNNQYPLPQLSPALFPRDATNPTFQPYIAALADVVTTYYSIAPQLFFGNAPVALSINGDTLGGARGGNICAANTALNTWFAFADSTKAPSPSTYNSNASLALNHPAQMSYFDDVFVQFYNEPADYYLGGSKFATILAQWGYVALLAQAYNRKKTTINIGLARGNIIPGGSPAVASVQGPTPELPGQGAPPYEFFYPQYATNSPPNATSATQNALFWPNTSPTLDPINLASAIRAANDLIRAGTGNPNIEPSDWCSGTGFWAGGNATYMAKAVYMEGNPASPGAILPHTQTYCWSDASYPSPDPEWQYNTPIVSTL